MKEVRSQKERMFASRLLQALAFIFTLISCDREAKKIIGEPISESDLISNEVFIQMFEIASPMGVLAQDGVFEARFLILCPDFPSELSLNIYLTRSLPEKITEIPTAHEHSVSVFPSSFACIRQFEASVTVHIPEKVKPERYYLVTQFTVSATKPLHFTSTTYVIKNVNIVAKSGGTEILLRDVKQIASMKVTNAIDSEISHLTGREDLRIFSVSSDGKLYLMNFFPAKLTFVVNIFDLRIPKPRNIDVISSNNSDIILIADEDEKNTEILKISGGKKELSELVPGNIVADVFVEDQNSVLIISENCRTSILIQDNKVSYVKIPDCDHAVKKSENIFTFRANEVTVISSPGSVTSFVLPTPDYIIETTRGFLVYTRAGPSIDVYEMNRNGLVRISSINTARAPGFSDYIPISRNSVLLTYRYKDSMTLYLWSDEQKITYTKTIPIPDEHQYLPKIEDGKVMLAFQKSHTKMIFMFSQKELITSFSLVSSGRILDFVSDSDVTSVIIRLPNRIGIYTHRTGANKDDIKFTRNTAERYRVISFSPKEHVIFYTDSAGCWENGFCRGNEFLLVLSDEVQWEKNFFTHENPIYQKFLDIVKLEQGLLFILQDMDHIRFFLF